MKLVESRKVDLQEIYAAYPRKEGKTLGIKKLSKELKTSADFERCLQAVKNYSRLCLLEGRDRQYIKLFSTFANCWEDYESAEDLGLDEIPGKSGTILKPVRMEDV